MKKIAIILPAYNEEATIRLTIEDFNKHAPEAEIWVANNLSTDSTESISLNTLNKLKCKGGVLNVRRSGKGNGIRCAFDEVEADIFVVADADLTYPAAEIYKLLQPIVAGEAEMVVGDRHVGGHYAKENKRQFHNFGNKMIRNLVNWLFATSLSDILSGYRVFSRRFVKTYPVMAAGFDVELDMTLHALDKRLHIKEVSISYQDRPTGSVSKLNTFKDGIRVILTLLNIFRYYRPLKLFGTMSFLLFFLGLIIGYPVIKEFLETGYVSLIPSAILASAIEIVAIITAAVALILDSIAYLDRRAFEREFINSKK
ncbi:glycosyltransferase family 2 protein [Candidatus Puniceispirillum sp.]|nr:glycosyltransferase family 2 protein [Candidatus Puniceispirillum sp.]